MQVIPHIHTLQALSLSLSSEKASSLFGIFFQSTNKFEATNTFEANTFEAIDIFLKINLKLIQNALNLKL